MKKAMAIILSLSLLFVLVACNGTSDNTSSSTDTSGRSQIVSSEYETSELSDSEDTETTDTEASSGGETDTQSKVKPQSTENPSNSNTNNNSSTNSKPSTSTSKPSSNTNNNSNSTNNNTTTTKPEESPYFVSYELISINRPITTYKVNGVPLLEKAYGTKYVMQVGDTATFKINMSDGGSTGFSVNSTHSCKAEINGNILKVTAIAGPDEKTDVLININTADGQKTIRLPNFTLEKMSGNLINNDMGMYNLFMHYAVRQGMVSTNYGDVFFDKIEDDVYINIEQNPDWIDKAFASIDKWVNAGYTKFSMQVVLQDGFEGSGGY